MRKQTKIAALVSAAALLTIGASMTAFAYGWTMEDGQWVYLDRYGDRVTDDWKASNGNYYWLDDDGYMAVSQIIEDGEDYYYVDATGMRVKNQWISVDNEEDATPNGEEVDTLWYYFGSAGKAVRGKKTLSWSGGSNKFFFDEDGHMMSGWYSPDDSSDVYYLGDENEGYAHTEWQYLEVTDDMTDGDYDDEEWFYFKSTGKQVKDKTEYISGRYYTFNGDGVLDTKWVDISTPPTASGANQYANVDGAKNGWVYTAKPEPNDDESAWYYLVTVDGVKTVAFGSDLTKDQYLAKVIGGKTYMFTEGGVMKSGLVDLEKAGYEDDLADTWKGITAKALKPGKYYFSKAAASQGDDGRMLTGRQTVDNDGENEYYYFNKTTGRAVENTIQDGILYGPDGKRIQAEDGNTYRVVDVASECEGEITVIKSNSNKGTITTGSIIVNSTGKVRTSGTKFKVGDERYSIVPIDDNMYNAVEVDENVE